MRPHVVAVCTGVERTLDLGNRRVGTGIDKRPVAGPIELRSHGLVGDIVTDTTHHGGPDQALYAYGQDDAAFWTGALGRSVAHGSFGENLRVAGVDPSQALIGERWSIGAEVVVEVTAPRIPCRVFAAFLDVPDLVRRFLAAGRPGAYLRVLAPGLVAAGDAIGVVARPDHGLTVAEVARIHTADRAEAARLLEVEGIAERIRAWAQEHVGVAGALQG